MKIQILGSGCPSCKALKASAKDAIAATNLDAQIEEVTDFDRISDMGVMVTPALAIDGVVKTSGKILKPNEIIQLIQGA